MIWRQSPSATTVEHNGITRILWVMQAGNQAWKRQTPRKAVYVAMGLGMCPLQAEGPAGSIPARDNQSES